MISEAPQVRNHKIRGNFRPGYEHLAQIQRISPIGMVRTSLNLKTQLGASGPGRECACCGLGVKGPGVGRGGLGGLYKNLAV